MKFKWLHLKKRCLQVSAYAFLLCEIVCVVMLGRGVCVGGVGYLDAQTDNKEAGLFTAHAHTHTRTVHTDVHADTCMASSLSQREKGS